MNSFVQDNTQILKLRKSQYNRTISVSANENQISENMVRIPKAKVNFEKTQNDLSVKIKNAAIRKRKQIEAKKEIFAKENRRIIDNALRRGTEKVKYSYEEYKYEEHNFPISFAAITLAITMVAVFLLLNYSQITKYNNSINKLEETIAQYNAEIAELDIFLDKKTNLTVIEKYAQENGLVTSEHISAGNYISMTDSYKMEKCNDTQEEFAISTVMSGVISLFGEVLR